MKKVSTLILAFALSTISSYAFSGGYYSYGGKTYDRYGKTYDRYHTHDKYCNDKPEITKVPEISAGGATIALALLGGLVLVARERRRFDQA